MEEELVNLKLNIIQMKTVTQTLKPKEEFEKMKPIIENQIERLKKESQNLPEEAKNNFQNIAEQIKQTQSQVKSFVNRYFKPGSLAFYFFQSQIGIFDKKLGEISQLSKEISNENLNQKINKANEILGSILITTLQFRQIAETLKGQENLSISQSDLDLFTKEAEKLYSFWAKNAELQAKKDAYKIAISQIETYLKALSEALSKEDSREYEKKIQELEAKVSQLESQLPKTILKTPIRAKVSKIFKKEGDFFDPQKREPLLELLPQVSYEIEAKIPAEFVSKIKEGMPVEITCPGIDQKLSGKIALLSPEQSLAKIAPDNLLQNIAPNMHCDVFATLIYKENVLVLPKEALKKEKNDYYVEVLQGKRKIKRKVKVGVVQQNLVEIVEGLKEKEKVILPK
ncbi:HlyD family efflux transporter periplasmic adaptor subunit [Candidatus Parcubacteria bacterium]|nr:HlyD family efflux transporter periplasmic adaptor subunit [Candidatus Parcubacteria bacterium]